MLGITCKAFSIDFCCILNWLMLADLRDLAMIVACDSCGDDLVRTKACMLIFTQVLHLSFMLQLKFRKK